MGMYAQRPETSLDTKDEERQRSKAYEELYDDFFF